MNQRQPCPVHSRDRETVQADSSRCAAASPGVDRAWGSAVDPMMSEHRRPRWQENADGAPRVAARSQWALGRMVGILVVGSFLAFGLPTAAGGDGAGGGRGLGAMGLGTPFATHGAAIRLRPGESAPSASDQVACEPREVNPSASKLVLRISRA